MEKERGGEAEVEVPAGQILEKVHLRQLTMTMIAVADHYRLQNITKIGIGHDRDLVDEHKLALPQTKVRRRQRRQTIWILGILVLGPQRSQWEHLIVERRN